MRFASLILLIVSGPALAESGNKASNRTVYSINQPVVSGNKAWVPGCPNWKSGARDSAAEVDPNYGCATNSNLAAMIADPQDLLHGKFDPLTGHDPETATRTLKGGKASVVTGTVTGSAPKGAN